MGQLDPGIVDQLKQILVDQKRDLQMIREQKKVADQHIETLRRKEEEVLQGIKQTREHLSAWGHKEDV